MRDIEVHADLEGVVLRVGTLRRHARRSGESVSFEYHPDWLTQRLRFALEPGLPLSRGVFSLPAGQLMFGSIGDSAPDTWGRRLMQRAERRAAERERRAVRTLMETDYLLGVSDVSRLGALRFCYEGEQEFLSPIADGVPKLIELGKLLQITERILRDEESGEDLQAMFAPGSSLGGARPKASVLDQHNRLAIAKFPKETDEYSVESWEAVALRLAANAGVRTPSFDLIEVAGRPVLLSRRFDRDGALRIPYVSALAFMGLKDGDRSSYPEIADVLTRSGGKAAEDSEELFRRMVLNILISNVDDHLRNHGLLYAGKNSWVLSPVFDINPTPADVRGRVLTTAISPDDSTCDMELALSVCGYFGLKLSQAKAIIKAVSVATAKWREIAKMLRIKSREIDRMSSAFEHDDLVRAMKL